MPWTSRFLEPVRAGPSTKGSSCLELSVAVSSEKLASHVLLSPS